MTPPHPLDYLRGGSGQKYSAKKKTIYSKSRLEQNKGLGCRTMIFLKISSAGLLRSPRKHNTALKKIGVAHILKIMNEVYGNRVGSSSQPQTIPLQQKLLICSLLLMLKRGKGKEVTLGKVCITMLFKFIYFLSMLI